jgi:hypothetical protein
MVDLNYFSHPKEHGDSSFLPASPSQLYVDLLKRAVTDTIYKTEPDPNSESSPEFLDGFIRHYFEGRAISMLPLARMDNIQFCAEDVIRNNVPGDFIETGVWRGGACVFMRGILKAHGISDRRVWVADSFEGLPKPDPEKFPLEAAAHDGVVMKKVYNHFAVSIGEVRENFARFGLLDDQVMFLKGWFKDTLPVAPIGHLALIRLDGDYYESTLDSLVNLYDKLSIGGYVIVDDYGEDSWTYCRKAIEDFRRGRRISDSIKRVDSKCHYWQRSQL